MALLINAIGGRYTTTYNAVDVGICENGYELMAALKEEVIAESDAYGGSLLDYFYRGGDYSLRFDSKEYAPGAIVPFWPWGVLGQMTGSGSPIGRLASALAKALVMTATAGTPAATAPATITAANSIMAPGQNGTLLFNSKLRRVPVFLSLLPYTSSGSVIWLSTT